MDARLLRLVVGDRTLLVPVDQVEVVIPTPPVSAVPATPEDLAGLLNYQGAIVPAVHPLADRRASGGHAVLVRSARHGRFALLCDWADDLTADVEGAELLDPADVAVRVLAGYDRVKPELPRPAAPVASVQLRPPSERSRTTGEGAFRTPSP